MCFSVHTRVSAAGRSHTSGVLQELSERRLHNGLDGALTGLDAPARERGAAVAEGEPNGAIGLERCGTLEQFVFEKGCFSGSYWTSSIWAMGAPSPRRGNSLVVRVKPPGRDS